jgi:hypothetical protein
MDIPTALAILTISVTTGNPVKPLEVVKEYPTHTECVKELSEPPKMEQAQSDGTVKIYGCLPTKLIGKDKSA